MTKVVGNVDLKDNLTSAEILRSARLGGNITFGGRGPKGDHGQPGAAGHQGNPGPQGIPGQDGPAGPPNTLDIGTVTDGDTAAATITGLSPNQTLNLVLPRGEPGLGITFRDSVPTYQDLPTSGNVPGDAFFVESDGLLYIYGASGFPAEGGGIHYQGPQGPPGQDGTNGQPGAAATIQVGTTTTGTAGSSAQVSNSGTSSAAVFNFTIPKGDKGDTGAAGANGAPGVPGQDGAKLHVSTTAAAALAWAQSNPDTISMWGSPWPAS